MNDHDEDRPRLTDAQILDDDDAAVGAMFRDVTERVVSKYRERVDAGEIKEVPGSILGMMEATLAEIRSSVPEVLGEA